MFFTDLGLLLFIAPALILAFIAQWMVSSAYARGRNAPARLSGYMAARHILDSAGLGNVAVEAIPGHLSDHYDPREKCCAFRPTSIMAGHWRRSALLRTRRAMPFKMPSAICRW